MQAWISLFSIFTPEVLLLEASLFSLLLCSYLVYFIVKKRRYGSVQDELPAEPVKIYLNHLINNAEQLRLQLFGILAQHPTATSNNIIVQAAPQLDVSKVTAQVNMSPDFAKKMTEMEARMSEQNRALESLTFDKAKLQKDLEEARSKASSAPTGDSNDAEQTAMKSKIEELEGKLSEYSIIEDDLANLKRLQQENTQLKKKITEQSEALAAAASVAEAPAVEESPEDNAANDEASAHAAEELAEFEKMLSS